MIIYKIYEREGWIEGWLKFWWVLVFERNGKFWVVRFGNMRDVVFIRFGCLIEEDFLWLLELVRFEVCVLVGLVL